ncbi:MAG: amidase family protein [Solimonas sp.]
MRRRAAALLLALLPLAAQAFPVSVSGQTIKPYNPKRHTGGLSSGSGAAIPANLATIGICEQSGASCQGPASCNGIATLLTAKGILPDNGGIGYQWLNDRAGIHARTLADAVHVLDALEDPASGSYDDLRDPFAAVPKALIPAQPYVSFIVDGTALQKNPRPLERVLRDRLGAELVETTPPDYPDDPDVPNLRYTFADALSKLLPRLMPELFSRADWVANARFREDKSRAGAENWIAFKDHEEAGKADRLARSLIARLALLKVMHENRIDAFVHPENTVPTPKIQGPDVGSIDLDGITPFFQIPRVTIPAGFSDVV